MANPHLVAGKRISNVIILLGIKKIYSDKIAKFACRCDERSNGAVISRLSKIYTHIFIDEVQDLAGYDLEFLDKLFLSPLEILLVGDPRQKNFLNK